MVVTRVWLFCVAVAACILLYCNAASVDTRQLMTIKTDMLPDEEECGFNCTSGECLDADKICDGTADCADKSDETPATCLNRTSHCPSYVYVCEYGACVDADARCNGKMDCVDGSDERNCEVPKDNSTCEFQCKSGECLDSHMMCDGALDCPDGSDETQETCSTHTDCPSYSLRCDYGACVDSDARCNGKKDCADGSDEKNCTVGAKSCSDGKFQCDDGSCVDGTDLCDGQQDCKDGSDETKKRCELFMCPSYAFRCDYGACVNGDAVCDGKQHCIDGSDESAVVCASTTPKHKPCPPLKQPANSKMEVLGGVAQFFCKPGYTLSGPDTILCHGGKWAEQPPSCITVSDDNSIPGKGSSLSSVNWQKLFIFFSIACVPWA